METSSYPFHSRHVFSYVVAILAVSFVLLWKTVTAFAVAARQAICPLLSFFSYCNTAFVQGGCLFGLVRSKEASIENNNKMIMTSITENSCHKTHHSRFNRLVCCLSSRTHACRTKVSNLRLSLSRDQQNRQKKKNWAKIISCRPTKRPRRDHTHHTANHQQTT